MGNSRCDQVIKVDHSYERTWNSPETVWEKTWKEDNISEFMNYLNDEFYNYFSIWPGSLYLKKEFSFNESETLACIKPV